MLGPKSISQKKFIVLLFIIAAAIVVILILFYGNFYQDPEVLRENLGSQIKTRLSGDLDLEILDEQKFLDLRAHGNLPVEVGELGRQNPFIKYLE